MSRFERFIASAGFLVNRALVQLALGVIAIYRQLSTGRPARCRFYPSCSAYAQEALQQHGFWRGCFQAAVRILKCHPWHPGGVDEVQPLISEKGFYGK